LEGASEERLQGRRKRKQALTTFSGGCGLRKKFRDFFIAFLNSHVTKRPETLQQSTKPIEQSKAKTTKEGEA
jgi:hypothetical protein